MTDVYDGIHHTPDYQNNGIMFLSVENISTLTSDKFISRDFFEQNYKIFPEKGDILLTRIGNVGTPNVVESTDKLAYYVSLALLKAPKINSYFLCNLICTQEFKKELHKKTLTTAIPQKINKDEIRKITFFDSTSSDERNKIGSLLKKITCTITLHEEKQRQLERLKKALLEKMFRDETGYPILRFKGFNNVWKQRKLGEVSSLRGRIGFRGYKQTDLVEKGKGAITFSPSDIDANGNISFLNNKYISIRKYEESPEIQVNTGDILFTKTASIGKIGYVKKLNEKATINPQIALLTPKIDFNGYFIFLSIRNDGFMRKVQKIVGGSSVPTMSQEKLKNLTINFPSSIEQHKLATIFLKIDGLITLHQHKIDNLKHLKRALLQKMFV